VWDRRLSERETYPVAPEDLDLVVRHDNSVEPVEGADDEYENVASSAKIGAHGHHE